MKFKRITNSNRVVCVYGLIGPDRVIIMILSSTAKAGFDSNLGLPGERERLQNP
jgi:hypothetical protein